MEQALITQGPAENGASQTMRERVERLEKAVLRVPQVECPVTHFNAPGQMARRMEIPAGTVVTGAVHKVEHLIIIAKGRLQIVTDEGTTEVKAGDVLICKPGMKNAVVTLEDSAWVNVFATDETDPEKLVELVTESKPSELLGHEQNKQLAANKAALTLEK